MVFYLVSIDIIFVTETFAWGTKSVLKKDEYSHYTFLMIKSIISFY